MITQEGPKAGGIALIKENTVTPGQRAAGPILTAVASPQTKNGAFENINYNNITPAAGGSSPVRLRPATVEPIPAVQPAATLSGRTVPPVAPAGLGGPNDSATDPTDPFAYIQARLDSAGKPSAPQPGSAHATAELEAGVTPDEPVAPLVNTMSTQSMAANTPMVTQQEAQASSLQAIAPAAGGDNFNR
jgi:hypothetical protein